MYCVWFGDEGRVVHGAGTEVARSSRIIESQLADFLVFLRRILSLRVTKRISAFVKWIDPLMSIISHKCTSGETSRYAERIGSNDLKEYFLTNVHVSVRFATFSESPNQTTCIPHIGRPVTRVF